MFTSASKGKVCIANEKCLTNVSLNGCPDALATIHPATGYLLSHVLILLSLLNDDQARER